MIRRIERQDFDGVLNLIKQFKEEALDKTAVSFHIPTLIQRILESIEDDNPHTEIAIEDNKVIGMLSGLIIRSYFDNNQILALELMWFINKNYRGNSYGIRLLKAFEDYALFKGASSIIMIAGHYSINIKKDKSLNDLYHRYGYKRLETHYIKKLGG